MATDGIEGVHRLTIGALEVFVVNDGFNVREDITRGFVQNAAPDEIAGALRSAGLPGPGLRNFYNLTLLRSPAGWVIFDAGTGGLNGPHSGGATARMRSLGIAPEDVALVVHTHFHSDHINGLTGDDGVANFPKARIAVPRREWEFWHDPAEESRAAESRRPNFALVRRRFAPYLDRISTFAPGEEAAPGVTAVATPGHSPGHNSLLIADGGAQLMVVGDAIHAPALFVAHPEWQPAFDMDKQTAVETRLRLLDRLATDRIPVIGYHFPMPATGRVERAGTSYRLVSG